MLNDPLANALSKINNSDKIGKESVLVSPVSSLIKSVFDLMIDNGYLAKYDETVDVKGNYYTVALKGAINKCGAVKPRFAVTVDTIEKYEKRFLPAKDFGFLIISTSQGLMTHVQAKEKNVGGKLIAYVY